jgi:scyllo-inositol 2-dehydrogenase (NADP+)
MKQLRTVVVGLGRIGWQFHLPEIDSHDGYILEAVVDPLADRRAEAHARFGVTGFADLPSCLSQVSADLVVLASPTPLHAEQAELAFAAGADVFTDKPMAPDLATADRMIAAAARQGRRLTVYQPERGSRQVVCLKSILSRGLIGDVYLIKHTRTMYTRRDDWQAWRQHGGGMLNNYGAHLVDACLHVAGSTAKNITCHLRSIATLGDADDVVKAVIEMQNGILLDIDINMASAQPMLPLWHVIGTTGSLQLAEGAWQARWFDAAELPPLAAQQGLAATARRYGSGEQLPWQEESFSPDEVQGVDYYARNHSFFTGAGEPVVPLTESRELMRVLDACRTDAASR